MAKSPRKSVDELFAWVADDADGEEGIVMMPLPGMGVVPLVCTTRNLAERMAGHATMAATLRATTVKLRRFTAAEQLRTIVPPEGN